MSFMLIYNYISINLLLIIKLHSYPYNYFILFYSHIFINITDLFMMNPLNNLLKPIIDYIIMNLDS